jgi:hypothetical protein
MTGPENHGSVGAADRLTFPDLVCDLHRAGLFQVKIFRVEAAI